MSYQVYNSGQTQIMQAKLFIEWLEPAIAEMNAANVKQMQRLRAIGLDEDHIQFFLKQWEEADAHELDRICQLMFSHVCTLNSTRGEGIGQLWEEIKSSHAAYLNEGRSRI